MLRHFKQVNGSTVKADEKHGREDSFRVMYQETPPPNPELSAFRHPETPIWVVQGARNAPHCQAQDERVHRLGTSGEEGLPNHEAHGPWEGRALAKQLAPRGGRWRVRFHGVPLQ